MAQNVERKLVYTVIDKPNDEKGWWVRVGTAFVNRDGSLNVVLDALPVNGKLHIRDPKPEDERDERNDDRRNDRRDPPPHDWSDRKRGGR